MKQKDLWEDVGLCASKIYGLYFIVNPLLKEAVSISFENVLLEGILSVCNASHFRQWFVQKLKEMLFGFYIRKPQFSCVYEQRCLGQVLACKLHICLCSALLNHPEVTGRMRLEKVLEFVDRSGVRHYIIKVVERTLEKPRIQQV